MYLEVDEGFPEHPKTLKLCALMGNPLAGFYMFHLWKWACRSCPDGNLRGIGVYEIEEAAHYHQHDGKLCAAMVESDFLDHEDDGSLTKIHNWMKRTGLAIKKMAEKAEENRKRRADARAKHDAGKVGNQAGIDTESSQHRTGTILTQTRQDKTSPDKTSPKKEEGRAPHVSTGKIRPRTPHDLEHCLRVAIQREQPQICPWLPGRFSAKDCDKILRDLGDVEAALPELERKIELFSQDPDMQPWTVAKFADRFNAIGLSKLEFGRSASHPPKPLYEPFPPPNPAADLERRKRFAAEKAAAEAKEKAAT
jgi:hypothetical protein